METLGLCLGVAVLYLVAYATYGRWLGSKIFSLSRRNRPPSETLRDGQDYVPTSKGVLFGHHFTSIAGVGPIVGPAVGIIWGWLPALVWVVIGSIFIGAVHDFSALVISLRREGKTVGDIAGVVITPRIRLLFLTVLFLALTIVLAIFGLVIAAVFRQFPQAIAPCLLQIPLAIGVGVFLHRRGSNLFGPSLGVLALMYVSVIFGDSGWLHQFNEAVASWPTMTWVVVLLAYSYVASVLPVWVLLQPRDYINSLQLLSLMALLFLGLLACGFFGGAPMAGATDRPPLELSGEAIQLYPEGAPPFFPFLFITIACGAISGFHCLVASGTSSKQVCCETDARFIGYGSMLTEGFLAVLVILACSAGIGLGISGAGGEMLFGDAAFAQRYSSWDVASGLGANIGTFVDGAGNFLRAIGIPQSVAVALMGVFVASFAGTTLDTSCRLQRYVVQELARAFRETAGADPKAPSAAVFRVLENKHGATVFAVVLAGYIAALPVQPGDWSWQEAGKGGLLLWPLFGATNQMLAGLTFVVVVFWVRSLGKPIDFAVGPLILMLGLPLWAMVVNLFGLNGYLAQGQWLLVGVGGASLLIEFWILIEAGLAWKRLSR